MYLRSYNGFGEYSTRSLSAPPKTSAADARTLRQAAKFARPISTTIQEIEQSIKFLATPAQKDLLREVVRILRIFFPVGYGVIDRRGKVIKHSTRERFEVNAMGPPRGAPFYFHHDTWLYLSFQKSSAAGRQRPFAPGHRNWIYLHADYLSSDIPTLARVLIHEMIHMLGHRYRSIGGKFGAKVAGGIPTQAAGALLDRSAFAPLRQVMEQRFIKLVEFLNRQPHRSGSTGMLQIPTKRVTDWGAHLVEEVLAFVITERATWALAQLHAQRSKVGLSQELVPMQFLKDYFRKYWLSNPKDRTALKTKDADRIFNAMEADLMKLVKAVRKHVGP